MHEATVRTLHRKSTEEEARQAREQGQVYVPTDAIVNNIYRNFPNGYSRVEKIEYWNEKTFS